MATQQQMVAEHLAPGNLDLHRTLGDPEGTEPELLRKAEKSRKALNGCVPLSHQVAGHMYGKDKVGILQHPDGTVLKQLQPPPRGPRELDFYNTVFATDCTDRNLLELQKFVPKYFGTWSPTGTANDLYLKLEDVTRKFKKPCIMDVKIGQKSYDPFASAEKVQQQISKYPLMEEIGFLVLGMRVYHFNSDSYETQNQHYGRSLTKDTVKNGLANFFHNGTHLRRDAVTECIARIHAILQWFENQGNLHFYASSLLFVYEGLSLQTTKRLIDGTPLEKMIVPREPFVEAEVPECNNNIHVLRPAENGKSEESMGRGYSKICALQKKTCSKRHHSQVDSICEEYSWKSSNNVSQEHLNGNVSKLESVFCYVPKDLKESSQVEVRMIDFAHVFPSNGKDEGYIYGLRNLISVLKSILND